MCMISKDSFFIEILISYNRHLYYVNNETAVPCHQQPRTWTWTQGWVPSLRLPLYVGYEIKPPDNNFAIYEVCYISSPFRVCLPLNPTPFHMLRFKKDHNPIHSREWQNNILQSKNTCTMITKHRNHTLNCSPYLYTRAEVGDPPVTPEPQVPFKSSRGRTPLDSGTEQSSHLVLKQRKCSKCRRRLHSKKTVVWVSRLGVKSSWR